METKKKLNMVEREEELAKVEGLMSKGMHRGSDIAKELKCSVPSAISYMEAILKRWELSKGNDSMGMRGQLIEKSREVEKAFWDTFQNADNSNAKVGALNGLLEVHKHQAWLAGTKKLLDDK